MWHSGFIQTRILQIFSQFSQIGSLEFQRNVFILFSKSLDWLKYLRNFRLQKKPIKITRDVYLIKFNKNVCKIWLEYVKIS